MGFIGKTRNIQNGGFGGFRTKNTLAYHAINSVSAVGWYRIHRVGTPGWYAVIKRHQWQQIPDRNALKPLE